MHPFLRTILKKAGVYYQWQSRWQAMRRLHKQKKYRELYKPVTGSGYTCNVCWKSYGSFVPDRPAPENLEALVRNQVMAGYGEHVICPNCLSHARERLVLAFCQNRLPVSGKKILHLSPERNLFAYLRVHATVITADLEPGLYRDIDPAIIKADARTLPFADSSFDFLIANHVLEHIPSDLQALQEFYRVVKPGGNAILQVPYSAVLAETQEEPEIRNPQKQSALFGQSDHVRIYALQDYIKRVRSAGFLVSLADTALLNDFARYATQPGEAFFLIEKPA